MARDAISGSKASIAAVPFEIQTAEQLETAFAVFARERVDALLVLPDTTFVAHHRRITELAASARLPAIYFNRSQVEKAGLMSHALIFARIAFCCDYEEQLPKGLTPQNCPSSSRPKSNW